MGIKRDLCGTWRFQLDENKMGIQDEFFKIKLGDEIVLPTTTAEAKKGKPNTAREISHLTEEYKFEGYAWYQREIIFTKEEIENLVYEKVVLFMERTRQTTVWIDHQYVGSYISFCAPHYYDLTPYIHKEKHTLTVMVSNVDYPTTGGHMTSPDTQTNWNGILGEISLNIEHYIQLQEVQLYPSSAQKQIRAAIKLNNFSNIGGVYLYFKVKKHHMEGDINKPNDLSDAKGLQCVEDDTDVASALKKVSLYKGINEIEIKLDIKEQLDLWDEYDRNLYDFYIEGAINNEKNCFQTMVTFGFREFLTDKMNFIMNGRKIFLRGKHDGMIFPLTGYAPMDKEGWLKVFKIAKEYGINHYRFHTCCPPDAAFQAADEVGMYLQPEIPFWGTVLGKDEEGYNEEMQTFLEEEGYRILREYGNHPSFVMMSMGNELWGNKQTIREMMRNYKKVDRRHLYTQGSNNFQFCPTYEPEDDFFSGVRFSKERLFRGSYAMCDAPLGHVQTMEPNTVYNYDQMIRPRYKASEGSVGGKKVIEIQYGTGVKKVEASEEEEMIPDIPVVSHEIGQYETFPNFNEIKKYTGVLKARNFEVFKERLEEKGLASQAQDFFMASGHLAAQCYKMELETAFRTKEIAGFQILDLQDFSGQGTALVGMLDAFMDNKGIVTAREWRSFCSDAVLLLELPSFVQEAGKAVEGKVKLCYYRPKILQKPILRVQMLEDTGKCIYEKEEQLDKAVEGQGLVGLREVIIKMPTVKIPQKVMLKLEIMGTDIQNQYEIWVYPKKNMEQEHAGIIVTQDLETAASVLKQGNKVLFMPTAMQNPNAIKGTYCTDFWCYPMFRSISESVHKEVPIGTMGLLIENTHPALQSFPSERYTTPSWWHIVESSTCTILDDTKLKPIVQTIDNFERNHKLGIIYEAQVGEGYLMVCTAQIKNSERIEERWLYSSLINYMDSSAFQPKQIISMADFKKIFTIKEN